MNSEDQRYLHEVFSDLLNYQSVNPTDSVDPLTYELPEGDNCLHIAAARGDKRAVHILIEAGLDVNKKGDMSLTPLHVAYLSNQFEIAKVLIEHKSDEQAFDEFGRKPADCVQRIASSKPRKPI